MKNFDSKWWPIAYGDGCYEVHLYDGPSTLTGSSSPDVQREAVRGYRACVAYIDVQLGKVLDALRSSEQSSSTLIVLVGDHGFHLG